MKIFWVFVVFCYVVSMYIMTVEPATLFWICISLPLMLFCVFSIFWHFTCDWKAGKQRRIIYNNPDLYKYYDKVSSAKHTEYLFFFKNPFVLYTEKAPDWRKKPSKPVDPQKWWS